ncbi:MAG: hypothetical protein KBB86_00225 [Candidatus Pacebacteria bacterium]|nr:hypothetical protein [Candidatus Paceibacterota bacterium]
MAQKTTTPEQMTLTEIIQKIIESAKASSREKVNQLMSHFEGKVSSTGRAHLRSSEKLIEGSKSVLGKETYTLMLEKVKTYM